MNYENTEDEGIEMLYRGISHSHALFTPPVIAKYNKSSSELELPELVTEKNWGLDYFIPEEYLEIDVERYIVERLDPTLPPEYTERVVHELDMYRTKKLYPMLRLMIYIVDKMQEEDVVYGVGRGSSVASYCLYLIGVHKIDSVKYNLDIEEFLK